MRGRFTMVGERKSRWPIGCGDARGASRNRDDANALRVAATPFEKGIPATRHRHQQCALGAP